MEERSSQNSNSHINWIVKVNRFRIRQDRDRQWRRFITMPNKVVTFGRRWAANYCATTAAMSDLASSLAKESAMQSITVNDLSSSSTVIGRLKSMFQQAGLIVVRCALSRVRCHYGLARSGKSRVVPNDAPFFVHYLMEANMKHGNFSKKILGIFTIGMLFLTGCSFNPDFGTPSPVVSEGTVYFYTLCHFNAVDEKSGELKWKMETVKGTKVDVCKEIE